MLMDSSAAIVSVTDIDRVRKQVTDLREELRRCMNRVEANRNGGHLLDNIVRDSFRLAQALKKSEARLKNIKTRRDEALKAREAAAPALALPVNVSER
jgi:hypothetical protein